MIGLNGLDILLARLRCPRCRAPLRLSTAHPPAVPGGVDGLLDCGQHLFPVLDGIPVLRQGAVSVQEHTTGRVEVAGPPTERLVELIRQDRAIEALTLLLAFPPAVPAAVRDRRLLRQPFTRWPGRAMRLAGRRGEVRQMLGRAGSLSARDWLDLCYLRSSGADPELHPYFLCRAGQPRFLATLALLATLPDDGQPVLDLACGFGHALHYLTRRPDAVDAVGLDRNFFQLWVARRYVAPAAGYVCADAAGELPFVDDAFGAAVCSDAFHYLPDQPGALNELLRCTSRGRVILDRMGNALLEPHEGDERTPAGYAELAAGRPHRLVGELDLVAGYLAGDGPQLATAQAPELLDGEKWITMVVDSGDGLLTDHPAAEPVPHHVGRLGVNPIYRVDEQPDGVRLLFEFPSTWYAFENAGQLAYHSAGTTMAPEDYQRLVSRGSSPHGAAGLLDTFVLLGMPERYLPHD